MKIGDVYEMSVTRLGIYGEGVGQIEGFTFFVPRVLPGEKVRVKITEIRKNFGRAILLQMIEPSLERQQPPCVVFGSCGGCQLMHLTYEGQLTQKRARVVDALERIGKFKDLNVLFCQPSPLPLAYRNKIQLPSCDFAGKIGFGLYAADSHDVVPIQKCWIHSSCGEEVFQCVVDLCQKWGLTSQDIRHLLIKTSFAREQSLVVFVTWKTEVKVLKQLAQELMRVCPRVKGVLSNWNPSETNRVLSSGFSLLAGEESIEEIICGLTFKVSAASFFQVNVYQAELLYKRALEWAELTGKEKVLDGYCGVGTLSLILAAQARKVIGIECVQEAIEDAKKNALANGIHNAEFICADAEEAISQIQEIDVAVINPPRKGCSPGFIESLKKLKPQKIIYISCDPATLARDLLSFKESYRLVQVQPFDMFPQTSHVESICQLVLI